ncbi:MAG: T9SS type A sorting domain-containing protein [Bacteroidetes bacterium]|nr:MAG: T9SS type A sorting domain-containing protein [Bacteroidota bacterium]
MKKHYFLHKAIFAVVIFIIFNSAKATDLTIQSIIQPKGIVQMLMQYQIIFIVANINKLRADNYYNQVTITKNGDPTYQWGTSVEGIPIPPYSVQQHNSTESWTPPGPGSYKIKVQVFYGDDIDHSNDSLSANITVQSSEIIKKYPFNFSQANFEYPKKAMNSQSGGFTVEFPPLQSPQFVSVMARLRSSSPFQWIVRNMPLLPFKNISKICYWFDYSVLNVENGVSVDSLSVSIKWTDSVMYAPFEVSTDSVVTVNKENIVINTNNGIVDTTLNIPITTIPLTFDSLTYTTWNYRGCTVPNIDLDSSRHNPGNTAGYSGDKNACGPAAAANSLEWLEKDHPKTPLTGKTHREKMEELSKMMDRATEDGVTTQQLVKGKLAFIDKYKLPIRVKFQSVFVGDSTIKSPNNKYNNEAKNHNTGNKTPPTWEWLKQEMNDGEDVEILFGWYDASGVRHGGHWVTVTGISEVKSARGLYFKDDKNQKDTGRTREQFVNWVSGNGGWSRFTGLNVAGYYPWIESVVSESYDSTIHQDAEPLGANECRFFEMMFGLDEKKGEVQMKVTPDEQPRYLNMWASKTESRDLKWIGWNILLAPFSVEQFYTFFFDFKDIGFNEGDRHDSIRFAYTVTDTPITKKDTIKNYTDIKLGTTNIIIGDGSSDTNLVTLPAVIPTIPGFEGWSLKTYVYRGCEVPNIDLDSTKNNPGTVPGYAGDKNACGPAAASNSLEWLANINPKLDPKNTHRDKLKELSALMNRANNGGVMREDFIKAKLAFIDKYKLPIKVKFQGFNFGTNDINSPNTDYGHKAINKNEFANKPPKWDWLVQEMKDSEDVELEFGFYDNTGTRRGGHWITVTGVSDVTTARGLYFKDDLNQKDSGGLRNPYVNLKDTLGYTYLQQLSIESGYTCWIETIVSESYDSTVAYTDVKEQQMKDEIKLKIIPNPSPSGKNIEISFILQNRYDVEAKIYDLQGNLISKLYNGTMDEGNQKFNWNCKNISGKNVSAGVYLISININGIILSEKIIIE